MLIIFDGFLYSCLKQLSDQIMINNQLKCMTIKSPYDGNCVTFFILSGCLPIRVKCYFHLISNFLKVEDCQNWYLMVRICTIQSNLQFEQITDNTPLPLSFLIIPWFKSFGHSKFLCLPPKYLVHILFSSVRPNKIKTVKKNHNTVA